MLGNFRKEIRRISADTEYNFLLAHLGFAKPKGFISRCRVPGMEEIIIIGTVDMASGSKFVMTKMSDGEFEVHCHMVEENKE